MCKVCNGHFAIRERTAAHDFMEQMREFYGLPISNFKVSRFKNEKKAIVNKIEHTLYRIQDDNSATEYAMKLRDLLNASINIDNIKEQFSIIMTKYYLEKLTPKDRLNVSQSSAK